MATSNRTTPPRDDNNPISPSVNPYYACQWLVSCGGQHEMDQCIDRKNQLKGIEAVYYSPIGDFRDFYRENSRNYRLKYNPKASTRVHLLIYTIRANGEREILFGLARRRKVGGGHQDRPFLSFPCATPTKRGDYGRSVVPRALHFITDRLTILDEGLRPHFMFQHSNVIYAVHVSTEQADMLIQNFAPNEDFEALHWISLETILESLTQWSTVPNNEQIIRKLARDEFIDPEGIYITNQYELWSVNAACLMYIQKHVPGGFDTFLP